MKYEHLSFFLKANEKVGIIAIGAPGCGKSTLYEHCFKPEGFNLVGTDKLIDAYAAAHGITYTQAFEQTSSNKLRKEMMDEMKALISTGKRVFVDQTNMTVKARADKLKLLCEAGYKVIALDVDVPTNMLFERVKAREAAIGKSIPGFVMTNMLKSYQAPTKAEGFDEIIKIDNS